MIADPPLEAGALQEAATVVLPGVTLTPVGAPGVVRGVTEAPLDVGPAPEALLAVTVTV